MKNTIHDYVQFRGDLSPIDFPYNEVDYLIFSELSYVNLDHIIPLQNNSPLTLQEAFNLFYQGDNNSPQKSLTFQSDLLFQAMAKAPRYQNIQITSYVNELDKELIKQFSAMAFLLEDETIVVSYRGTDDALIGWHENFLMLCESIVPAQLSAVKYLEHVLETNPAPIFQSYIHNRHLGSVFQRLKKYFQYKKNRPIILTGHSKGGNLAMYAACFSDTTIKENILKVYSYDGPGFQDDIIVSSEYKEMLPRIHSYIPHYSFFGIVLGHEEDYTVVHSHDIGMLQHDGFSWEVGPDHFISDELSFESVEFAIKVIIFLEKLSKDDKLLFVNAMFSLFEALGLYTFTDLSHISYKHILSALKELTLLDSKVRKMLIEVLHMLWLEAKKTKKS